jgi:hypothetical protein
MKDLRKTAECTWIDYLKTQVAKPQFWTKCRNTKKKLFQHITKLPRIIKKLQTKGSGNQGRPLKRLL